MKPAIQKIVAKHLGRSTAVASKRVRKVSHKHISHGSIEELTPIIPIAMAESVVDKAARLLDEDLQNTTLAEQLVRTAETIFQHNKTFRKKVMATNGRDYLWGFMQHWLTSDLLESRRYDRNKLRHILIDGGFSMGKDAY